MYFDFLPLLEKVVLFCPQNLQYYPMTLQTPRIVGRYAGFEQGTHCHGSLLRLYRATTVLLRTYWYVYFTFAKSLNYRTVQLFGNFVYKLYHV